MASSWLVVALHLLISHAISPPVVRATIYERCVYTSGVVGIEPNTKWTFGGGNLWLQKTNLKETSEITSLEYVFGISGRRDALLRWQLIKGQYYCVGYSWGGGVAASAFRCGDLKAVPLAEIETVNANRKAPGLLDRRKKYEKLIEYGPHFNPVAMATGWGEDSARNRAIFFDFWCREGKRLEVYVTAPRPDVVGPGPFGKPLPNQPSKDNRLTRGDFHPENKIRGDQDPKIQWQTVGEWKIDWDGPFYVAVNGDDRYFVTDTGRVFATPRPAKPVAPLKEIWKGKPVDALIRDDDSKKWYAFTKDEYFEIADPIKPKPHTIAIRREWTANKALETAAKCGRVIRGIPEPKEKPGKE